MLNILTDLANELDNNQAHRLADKITSMMKTASDDYDHEYDMVRNQMETAERAIEGIEDVVGEEGAHRPGTDVTFRLFFSPSTVFRTTEK